MQPEITVAGISPDVTFGNGCKVVAPVNLYGCDIGHHVRIGPFVEVQDLVMIGDRSVIQSHTFIAGGTRIEEDVFIGHHVTFCNDRNPRANNRNWRPEPAIVRKGASIGSGAVILPGVEIGAGAMVGAGMIVAKDVPPGARVHMALSVHQS